MHNNFVGYPANIRYVSQPVYMSTTTTASNVYRDPPFHSRALNVSYNICLFKFTIYILTSKLIYFLYIMVKFQFSSIVLDEINKTI